MWNDAMHSNRGEYQFSINYGIIIAILIVPGMDGPLRRMVVVMMLDIASHVLHNKSREILYVSIFNAFPVNVCQRGRKERSF